MIKLYIPLFIIFMCFVISIFFRKKQPYYVSDSTIHNKGLFSNQKFNKNDVIGVAVEDTTKKPVQITKDFGVWLNHCVKNTNAHTIEQDNKLLVVASKNIEKGDELLTNYNTTPNYIKNAEKHYKEC